MKKKPIIFIKLGGSVITNKTIPNSVRIDVLQRLVKEITRAKKQTDALFIVGHGSGSFGHVPATQYQTMKGFINDDSPLGMAITQDTAAQLNRIVVAAFVREKVPAVSFPMSGNTIIAKNGVAQWGGDTVLQTYLAKGLVPITYGDVLVDQKQGCTIWSTETVFNFLIDQLQQTDKYEIKKVIHVSRVPGVLDARQQLIPHISDENSAVVRSAIIATDGFDVTGGMWHKVEESLQLADRGINTHILSGLREDNLYQALTDHDWIGTHIS